MGKLTFPHPQGGSVVDYFIASSALFALHPSLTLSETQPESDHRPLHLHLHLPSPSMPNMLQHSHCMQKLRHRPHLIPQYRDALATQLSIASTMQNSAEWLQACIATSATATHGMQPSTHTLHAPKPWFDAECWQARQALRRASHLASVHHHHSSLLLAYKALLRRKRRAWEKCQNEELSCLAAKDPGKFWRQYRKREDAPTGISTSAWYQAFSSLLAPAAPASIAAAPIMGAYTQHNLGSTFEHLHDSVSTAETARALKRLRRNKAAGIDGIRAEHLLDACQLLLEPMAATYHTPSARWSARVLMQRSHPPNLQGRCQGRPAATTVGSQSRLSSPSSLP